MSDITSECEYFLLQHQQRYIIASGESSQPQKGHIALSMPKISHLGYGSHYFRDPTLEDARATSLLMPRFCGAIVLARMARRKIFDN